MGTDDAVGPLGWLALALAALRRRIILKPDAEIEGLTANDVLSRVLAGVEVPR